MPSQGALGSKLGHATSSRTEAAVQPESDACVLGRHPVRAATNTERNARDSGLLAVRLSRVLEFIDAHLDTGITLADLAHEAHLSVFYFATQFKRSTGLSPQQYILHRRVNRARELLRTTSLSVLDVSLDLGFQHQNNFTRAFRRITGTTPTRFRQDRGL